MGRTECEQQIIEKLQEMWAIYKEYNPNGKYLSACVIEDEDGVYFDAHNAYYSNGLDVEVPMIASLLPSTKEDEENE